MADQRSVEPLKLGRKSDPLETNKTWLGAKHKSDLMLAFSEILTWPQIHRTLELLLRVLHRFNHVQSGPPSCSEQGQDHWPRLEGAELGKRHTNRRTLTDPGWVDWSSLPNPSQTPRHASTSEVVVWSDPIGTKKATAAEVEWVVITQETTNHGLGSPWNHPLGAKPKHGRMTLSTTLSTCVQTSFGPCTGTHLLVLSDTS